MGSDGWTVFGWGGGCFGGGGAAVFFGGRVVWGTRFFFGMVDGERASVGGGMSLCDDLFVHQIHGWRH